MVEEVHFYDAEDMLDYLRASKMHWGNSTSREWVFRGHRDSSWLLVPRAWREDGRKLLRPLIEHVVNKNGDSLRYVVDALDNPTLLPEGIEQRHHVLELHAQAASIAIREFASLANDLGLQLGDANDQWTLTRDTSIVIRSPSLTVALAQHHGIPTFLLDWTTSPLVAAYFASATPYCNELAIWALHCDALSPANSIGNFSQVHCYMCPRFAHTYLHAQGGLFLWIREIFLHNYFGHNGKIPTLIDAIDIQPRTETRPLLRKLTLPGAMAARLRFLLLREGVSEAHLMPTFDNISLTVQSMWKSSEWQPSR